MVWTLLTWASPAVWRTALVTSSACFEAVCGLEPAGFPPGTLESSIFQEALLPTACAPVHPKRSTRRTQSSALAEELRHQASFCRRPPPLPPAQFCVSQGTGVLPPVAAARPCRGCSGELADTSQSSAFHEPMGRALGVFYSLPPSQDQEALREGLPSGRRTSLCDVQTWP